MLSKKSTAAIFSTHDRPVLQLLKHVRHHLRPGQTQEPSLQQLKEKGHVSQSALHGRFRLTQVIALGNEITHNLEGHQQIAGILLPIHDLDEAEGEVGTQAFQLCRKNERGEQVQDIRLHSTALNQLSCPSPTVLFQISQAEPQSPWRR